MLDELLQFVPKPLQKAYLALLANIPEYARNLCVVGESAGVVGYLLKKRPSTTVTAIVPDARLVPKVREMVDTVIAAPDGLPVIPECAFHAVLFCNLERNPESALAWLEILLPKLHRHGHVFALFGDPSLPAGASTPGVAELEAEVTSRLSAAGVHVYMPWYLHDGNRNDGPIYGEILMGITEAYNPVLHARDLRAAGALPESYFVLNRIPAAYTENPENRETVCLEKLITVADWMGRLPGQDLSHLLSRAQDEFYILTHDAPALAAAYQGMALCWEQAGNQPMARRLLRSIQYAAPDAAVDEQYARLSVEPAPDCSVESVPAWDTGIRPRVLFIMHPRPHYGLDVLFDGLCDCLGDENVVEFPWKPTLHGGDSPDQQNYPCRFDRRGEPRTAQQLAGELRAGCFDFILFGDIEGDVPHQDVQTLLQARGVRPVFLVDALDEMCNFRPTVGQRLDLADFDGYFKREMVWSVDYGPHAYPLPFAHALPRDVPLPETDRPYDFFWAGHRRFGQRRLYLEALEARHGWNLARQFNRGEYQHRLRESRIGLNCFGMGFDTVRFWELPAHGCMLLSDRLPLRIPFAFQDGVHAVFFDDLPDLLEKTDYYLTHLDEAATIAAAGHAHFRRYHTNRARATQLLGWVDTISRA